MLTDLYDCPGRYCGRTKIIIHGNTTTWSDCSMCLAGFRTNSSKQCEECSGQPTLYQWMYLGFIAALPLFLNWVYIFYYHQSWKRHVIFQLASSLFESCASVLLALLVTEPRGGLTLTSCAVVQLSDWYTVFYNPKIKHSETIFCAQEAVYPLYSIAFVYYLFSLLLMLLVRLVVLYKFINQSGARKPGVRSLYAALYFLPLIVLAHALLAGLIYYSFGYILIVATLLALVVYCVQWEAVTIGQALGKDKPQHLFIITCHLMVLSYAVIGIGNAYSPHPGPSLDPSSLPYLTLVPVPFLFFLATERFTRPHNVFAETTGTCYDH